MGTMTLNVNVLMKRWMEIYMNLNILQSRNLDAANALRDMKNKLAEANEVVMQFFHLVEADPEAEG